jgi:hypothetical protein
MNLNTILNITDNLNTVDYIGTDKNTTHAYVEHFYEEAFKKYQDKNISLLEIGINSGGSLYLWGKYFYNGNILGIDIEDNIKEKWKVLNNVKHLIKDAYDLNTIKDLPKFDIIIDDGPHTLESQIWFIENYLTKMMPNGLLVIEDIQDIAHIEVLKQHTPKEYLSNAKSIDLRSYKNRYDDILYVIYT